MDLADKLAEQAEGLELDAEAFEAIARHFRPRFEACWKDGRLVDSMLALRLRTFVLENENSAKQYRRQASEVREAITALTAGERETK